MNPPRCWFLIGPPAAGKSTWRSQIDPTSDYVPISGDDLIEEECARTGKTYSEVFVTHDFKEQKRILRERFLHAITEKRDIVIDRTNLTIKGRRSFLASLPKNYHSIAIVFDYEKDALFERLAKRGEETGKIIPVKVVEDMIASYQPPTGDEFNDIIHWPWSVPFSQM